MKYNGIDLVEVTEPQVFNPPKKMLVWDGSDNVLEKDVLCIVKTKNGDIRAITENYTFVGLCAYMHCAEIPEESEKPKSRRATNRELAKWLAKCNGEMTFKSKSEIDHLVYSSHCYEEEYADEECDKALKRDDDGSWIVVRKWGDKEWHEPTAEYLGLEE